MTDEKKTDVWMPIWIGSYLADTMDLTTLQHGAYFLLLLAYWRKRGPLADNDDTLRSIAKMDRAEWKRAKPVLAAFFRVGDGVWWHKRVEAELIEADARAKKASEKGAKAAQARWGKGAKQPAGTPSGNATGMPQALPKDVHEDVHEECPPPSPLPLPSGVSVSDETGPAGADRSVDKSSSGLDQHAESKRILRQDARDWLIAGGLTARDAQVCINTIAANHPDLCEAALREAIKVKRQPGEAESYLHGIVRRMVADVAIKAVPATRAEKAVEATQELLKRQEAHTAEPPPADVKANLAALRTRFAGNALLPTAGDGAEALPNTATQEAA